MKKVYQIRENSIYIRTSRKKYTFQKNIEQNERISDNNDTKGENGQGS